MRRRQRLAAPLLTKNSLVNPTTTASESRSYPALRRSTVSQSNVPGLAIVPAPVTDREARTPDLALRGTVQTSNSAVCAPTYVLPNPLGADYARITTQNYPRAIHTDPTETYAGVVRHDVASARTVCAPPAQLPHAPRVITRIKPRKVQFSDLASADPASPSTIPVASQHKKRAQGKRKKLMEPAPWMRFHPFVATLEHWAAGVSALCGEPWSEAALCAAIERGSHTSALTPEAHDLIDEEMKYQIQAGFSEMVLWRTIQHAYPTYLKVSPLAVIPQVGRRGRLLLDLSFLSQAAQPASKQGRRTWVVPPPFAPSVNSTTIQQLPDYPVKQLGRVLPQLLAFAYVFRPTQGNHYACKD